MGYSVNRDEVLETNPYLIYSGSRLIGRLGSRHSVPFIRFSRITDVIILLDTNLFPKLRSD